MIQRPHRPQLHHEALAPVYPSCFTCIFSMVEIKIKNLCTFSLVKTMFSQFSCKTRRCGIAATSHAFRVSEPADSCLPSALLPSELSRHGLSPFLGSLALESASMPPEFLLVD